MINSRTKPAEIGQRLLRVDERIEIARSLIAWLTADVPVIDRSYSMECMEQLNKMLRCLNFNQLQICLNPIQPGYSIDIDIAAEIYPGSFVFFPASFRLVP